MLTPLSALSIAIVGLQILSVVGAEEVDVDFFNPNMGGGSMLNDGKFNLLFQGNNIDEFQKLTTDLENH